IGAGGRVGHLGHVGEFVGGVAAVAGGGRLVGGALPALGLGALGGGQLGVGHRHFVGRQQLVEVVLGGGGRGVVGLGVVTGDDLVGTAGRRLRVRVRGRPEEPVAVPAIHQLRHPQ